MSDVHGSRSLDTTEVYRRLPLLDHITDEYIREETARVTATAPDYFWRVPASTSGYHPKPCRQQHGLWAHTLMVAQAVEDLLWTYRERGALPEHNANCARAAALLHDQRKNGPGPTPTNGSVDDHDLLMAEVIREDSSLPNTVADAVASHMGGGYDGPPPLFGGVGDLVHMADYAASRTNWRVRIDAPLPAELSGLDIHVRGATGALSGGD